MATADPSHDFSFAFNNKDHSNRTLTVYCIAGPSESNVNEENVDQSQEFSQHIPETRKETLYVNTAILGKESEFFRLYFSSGFVETWQMAETKDPKGIRVDNMDLFFIFLEAMYKGGEVPAHISNDPDSLLHLVMLCDEFRASSMLKSCSRALERLPMSLSFAVSVFSLPQPIKESDNARGLLSSARRFLEKSFQDLDAHIYLSSSEFWNLPLQAIECLLGSPRVKVASEDTIFFAVLEWASRNLPPGNPNHSSLISPASSPPQDPAGSPDSPKGTGCPRGDALVRIWSLLRLPQMSGDCLLAIRKYPDAFQWIEPWRVDEALKIRMMDPRGVSLLYGSVPPFVPRPGKWMGPALLTWTLTELEIVDLAAGEVRESEDCTFVCGNWYGAELRKTRPGTMYENTVQIRLVERDRGPQDCPFLSIKGKRVIEASCTVGTPSRSRVSKGPCQLVRFGENLSVLSKLETQLNPNPNPNIGELTVGTRLWSLSLRDCSPNSGPKLNELTFDLGTQRYVHPAVGSVFDDAGLLQITLAFQSLSAWV